ncbi:hypothetical protein B1R32_107166 [Abditibacterium utsteinense]|uniref:Zinc-ribbon domain-containing protein n=1 Tax=Abditibacterium utsteinense TaxID=1960156 RepID=A0A2S8STM0_9BACT|nr:hypothetical protein [Abditibacterium utsteinense]PQV64140.1 hypothetical protein B1R32_107166 [Abditibacterium utsteinense]
MNEQAGTQLFALMVAGGVAGWVRFDAQKRGFKAGAAIGWSVGVFLVMIVFLPLYLWARRNSPLPEGALQTPLAPIAGVPCPYCGYENAGSPDYCAKCGRQLRSSTEIHR